MLASEPCIVISIAAMRILYVHIGTADWLCASWCETSNMPRVESSNIDHHQRFTCYLVAIDACSDRNHHRSTHTAELVVDTSCAED
jgi:hypothetical protein